MPEQRLLDSYADPALTAGLLAELGGVIDRPLRFMEVCGTHTMAIFESGLRPRLAELGVTLLSGPGCPVCVTDQADIDFALRIAADPQVTFCTFGDMLRVPGTSDSLAEVKARGGDVRVVYSPLDALALARKSPQRRVVFLAIGFETTAPAIAWTVKQAASEGVANFLIYPCHKTIPGPMIMLARNPELNLDGFLCPGHVSVVIGAAAYQPVAREGGKPCAIAGFEPVDILAGVLSLARQVREGLAEVENTYGRVVMDAGNPLAQDVLSDVFRPADVVWRGLGVLPQSGLELNDAYAAHDVRGLYPDFAPPPPDPRLGACRCGEVLIGRITPPECGCFGAACTPDQPLGPCMVSQEGSCQAYYRYQGVPEVPGG